MALEASNFIINVNQRVISACTKAPEEIGFSIPIPQLKEELLRKLIDETLSTLKDKPVLLSLKGPFVVAGAIHGNYTDLIRIFLKYGFPPETNYIFLGDYVDDGEYSVEVVSLLFALKNKYPENIYLLRGDHEDRDVNSDSGFLDSIIATFFNGSLWEKFNMAFAYLPVAAVLNDEYLLIHGGISQRFNDITDLNKFAMPIVRLPPLIADILSSTPSQDTESYQAKKKKQNGCFFGQKPVDQFIYNNRISTIIRCHDYDTSHELKNVLTICSNSKYNKKEKSGIVALIEENQDIVLETLPELVKPNKSLLISASSPNFHAKALPIPAQLAANNSLLSLVP